MPISDRHLSISLVLILLVTAIVVSVLFYQYDEHITELEHQSKLRYSLVCNGDSFIAPQESKWRIDGNFIRTDKIVYKPSDNEVCIMLELSVGDTEQEYAD